MLKPVHIPTINTDAERLARSSQGTSRDIEAVARAWDKDALALPNMFKRGSITISTLKPLPPEAKKHIALAAPVTTHIMYEVDGVEEDGPDDSHDKSDPWVKVGTTTIDGTLEQVAARVVGCNSIPKWVDSEGCERVIDEWMRDRAVLKIGGQHLRPCGSHINASRGTALIRCDVVRRQSEIDAERDAEVEAGLAAAADHCILIGPCDEAGKCPECGPHGNRGEVLLASSWARCTTCAGGKPGDLWGEVKAHEPATAQEALSSALIAKGASSEVARREALLVQLGQGFKVPTLAERTAELDSLRRHLTKDTPARYDDATIAKWANIVCNLSPGDWIV